MAMDHLVLGSATGIFSNVNTNADFFSVDVDLTKEEMNISGEEYEIQKALGSLPQKTVSGDTFNSFPSVSGLISHSCHQMYKSFTGIWR